MKRYSLVNIDGNAFSIMAYVQKAMRNTGFEKKEIDSYIKDAMSSDYDHLLLVSVENVDKSNKRLAKKA